MPHADRLYVGGRWVAPTSAKTFAVLNCATEDVVAHAAMANEADVDAAVHAARTAFDRGPWPHRPRPNVPSSWRKSPPASKR